MRELERLAELYEEGYGGLAPNREKAIELYKKLTANSFILLIDSHAISVLFV